MGLTSYKGEEVRKDDVTVAKNYLTQDEVSELNRVVNMWLDFAEDQARRRQQIFYATGRISWISSCNLTTVRFYKAQVKSLRKWPMKKRRRNIVSLLNNNGA